MRVIPSLIAISGALAAAAPLSAQSTARDFQLPSSATPTPTPSVEGPVDDSGVVPVGPRAPTTTPAPAPSPTPTSVLRPTPTPTQAPTSQSNTPAPSPSSGTSRAVVQPIPTATRRPQQQPTQTRRIPQPSQTRAPVGQDNVPAAPSSGATEAQTPIIPVEDGTAPPSLENGQEKTAPTSSAETPAPAPVSDGADTAGTAPAMRTMPQWMLWAGGALLALIAGLFFWRRRKTATETGAELLAAPLAKTPNDEAVPTPTEPAPTEPAPIEPAPTEPAPTEPVQADPVQSGKTAASLAAAPAQEAAAAHAPNLDLKLEIEQLSRSMMMMSLKCRVTLSNRSDKAARDITVSADLVSANRALPMEAQTAGETAFLPEIGSNERIGPHKTFSAPATLTLPLQQVAVFQQAGKPLCVPLVRVRMDAKGAEPTFRTFVVGIAADPSLTASTKLHPVPLDGIPGSFPNVRHRPLDEKA